MPTFVVFDDEAHGLKGLPTPLVSETYSRRLQEARFHAMAARAVPCDANGTEVRVRDLDDEAYSHVKLRVKSVHVEEYHMLDGEREPVILRLDPKRSATKVEQFKLHLGTQEFDLQENWEVVFDKRTVALPARGFVSLTYTSTIFGRWFVDLKEVPIGFDLKRPSCLACAVQ